METPIEKVKAGSISDHYHEGVGSRKIDVRNLEGTQDYRVAMATTTISNGTTSISDFTTGIARLGDFVLVGSPQNMNGALAVGYVSGSGTTTIAISNESGATVTINKGIWQIKIIKK